MGEPLAIRRLLAADLAAYKALRDATLAAHPLAFTSDAAEERAKPADTYLPRLGLAHVGGGHFTLGAWQARQLVGAIGCERETRAKARHAAHVVGMMVRSDRQRSGIGRALLAACIKEARAADGLQMLTLSVSAGNAAAIGLYARTGFVRYGSLPRAIRVGGTYYAKDLMVLML